MTSVLLTGAAGMIGRVVLRQLEASGVPVWTTDRVPLDRDLHITGDLEDPIFDAALADLKPDAVIHLAGATGGGIETLMRSNILATTNLLEAIEPRTRIVLAGSAAEYAPPRRGTRLSETGPLGPVGAYGWAKVAQSTTAAAISKRRGLRLTIARPFNVVGADLPASSALGNMRSQLLGHRAGDSVVLETGRLDVVRDFVPVDFVGRSLIAIALDERPVDAVNVCSGIGIELRAVVEAMADHLSITAEFSLDPELAAIPALEKVVGDPTRLVSEYGLRCAVTPTLLAATLLENEETRFARERAPLPSQRPDRRTRETP